MEKAKKRKRVVTKPMKRWTLKEEEKILQYLIANQPIELPTAIAFYRQMVDDFNWDMEPNLVRHKVKNMKEVFFKHLSWVQRLGENEDCDEKMITNHLKRRCPHFKKLELLFSNSPRAKAVQLNYLSNLKIEEDNTQINTIESDQEEDNTLEDDCKFDDDDADVAWDVPESQVVQMYPESDDPLESAGSTKNKFFDKEQLSLEWMKLEIEKEKLSIAKEKIAMQREQNQEEAKYRILELEQKGILKRLQIEKDTEVRKYELSLKYKTDHNSEL